MTLPDSQRLHTSPLVIKLTKRELRLVKHIAIHEGLTQSAWARVQLRRAIREFTARSQDVQQDRAG